VLRRAARRAVAAGVVALSKSTAAASQLFLRTRALAYLLYRLQRCCRPVRRALA